MPRYRKLPVEIEARRFESDANLSTIKDLAEWCDGENNGRDAIVIPTLEGNMIASPGDWIIKGVHGEFYPCKPEIFAATYEEVE